jgi:hypothetical protein
MTAETVYFIFFGSVAAYIVSPVLALIVALLAVTYYSTTLNDSGTRTMMLVLVIGTMMFGYVAKMAKARGTG